MCHICVALPNAGKRLGEDGVSEFVIKTACDQLIESFSETSVLQTRRRCTTTESANGSSSDATVSMIFRKVAMGDSAGGVLNRHHVGTVTVAT